MKYTCKVCNNIVTFSGKSNFCKCKLLKFYVTAAKVKLPFVISFDDNVILRAANEDYLTYVGSVIELKKYLDRLYRKNELKSFI